MEFIERGRLTGLNSYKYSSVDKSLISKYVLQPYWTRLVLLFPLWMAYASLHACVCLILFPVLI